MARPVTVFCGKGGVGKTALSLAHALSLAARGHRVLVITSHPLPELALSVSLAGLKESDPGAAANLFVIHIDPRDVLRQLVKRSIASSLLADTVLSSRIYQSLIEVIPGLKEVAFVSRLRDLAVEGSGLEAPHGFDAIVWDAPATGHFLRTLEAARGFNAYLSGPLALLGESLAGFLADPSSLTIIPVTTLEEMAVGEVIELCGKLAGELQMQPAALICNMTSPVVGTPDDEWEQLRRTFLSDLDHSPEAAFILDRLAIERALFERLARTAGISAHILQRRTGPGSDVAFLRDLAESMGNLPGANLS